MGVAFASHTAVALVVAMLHTAVVDVAGMATTVLAIDPVDWGSWWRHVLGDGIYGRFAPLLNHMALYMPLCICMSTMPATTPVVAKLNATAH